jgi:hypothetical protein
MLLRPDSMPIIVSWEHPANRIHGGLRGHVACEGLCERGHALPSFVPTPEDYPKHLRDEEDEALYELAFTPCASDAEFLGKLRYLYTQQA